MSNDLTISEVCYMYTYLVCVLMVHEHATKLDNICFAASRPSNYYPTTWDWKLCCYCNCYQIKLVDKYITDCLVPCLCNEVLVYYMYAYLHVCVFMYMYISVMELFVFFVIFRSPNPSKVGSRARDSYWLLSMPV